MPPEALGEATDALFRAVLHAFGVAAAVFTFFCGLAPKRLAGLAAALALAAAFVQGNYLREAARYRLDEERPLSVSEFRAGGLAGHQPPIQRGTGADQPRRPNTGCRGSRPSALLTDALLRWPCVVAWLGLARAPAVAPAAARLLMPEDLPQALHVNRPWPEVALAGLILARWAVPWFLARRQAGGAGSRSPWPSRCKRPPIVVLMEASWLRLATWRSSVPRPWPASAWRRGPPPNRRDATAGVAAILLPGVLLIGQQQLPEGASVATFVLAGLSPLALRRRCYCSRGAGGRRAGWRWSAWLWWRSRPRWRVFWRSRTRWRRASDAYQGSSIRPFRASSSPSSRSNRPTTSSRWLSPRSPCAFGCEPSR